MYRLNRSFFNGAFLLACCLAGTAQAQSLAGLGVTKQEVSTAIPNPHRDSMVASNGFGDTSTFVSNIGAFDFRAVDADGVIEFIIGFTRNIVSSTLYANAAAGVSLPSGAQITGMELEACDNVPGSSQSEEVGLTFYRCPVLSPGIDSCIEVKSLGTGGNPGCGTFFSSIDLTVDNNSWSYYVTIDDEDSTQGTRWRGARIYWKRQIATAPSTATFIDVPKSYQLFKEVEAMAASGITLGCTANGQYYCPNAPVTRGQMAAFFARALGLHFAP